MPDPIRPEDVPPELLDHVGATVYGAVPMGEDRAYVAEILAAALPAHEAAVRAEIVAGIQAVHQDSYNFIQAAGGSTIVVDLVGRCLKIAQGEA